MGRRLFVTGASGYVGRTVVTAATASGAQVTALVRSMASVPRELADAAENGGLEIVEGDLLEPASWAHRIEPGACVLHLAAATGKAPAAEHHQINVDGTATLLAAATEARAAHFVLVSSIAVRFPDQAHYPYAHSKSEAERRVRDGGLPWTIVRPAIVVGPDAPVLRGFATLAGLPVTPVFGAGQREVQPVDVRDLADALVALCEEPQAGAVLEIGGPERVSIDTWMHRIRASRGQGPARILHLPLGPSRALLALLEPLFLRWLPLTAGQLATFANDGVATPDPFMEARHESLRPLAESLRAADPVRLEPEPFDAPALEDECRTFTLHLLGVEPPDAVVKGYLDHHREHPAGPFSPFERQLLRHARRGGLAASLADAYSGRFLRDGLLRRKLTLLLALLETDRATFERIDAPEASGSATAWLQLLGRGVAELGLLLVATLWFGPRHLTSGEGPER